MDGVVYLQGVDKGRVWSTYKGRVWSRATTIFTFQKNELPSYYYNVCVVCACVCIAWRGVHVCEV